MREMFVQVKWQDRELGIPLEKIKPLKVDKETKEAIEDWHYWMEMAYMF